MNNLAALDSLRREVADDPNDEAKKAELRAQIESIEFALSGHGEVVLQKGLVIDRIPSEDILIIDPTLIDLSNYRRAKTIAQRVWMTKSDYGKTFGHDVPDGAATFNNRLMIDEPTDAVPASAHFPVGYNVCARARRMRMVPASTHFPVAL